MKNSLLALCAIAFFASCATVPREPQPAPAPAAAAEAPKKAQLLFVQNAKGVALKGNTMFLKGVSPSTVFFSDRPERIHGHILTRHFVSLWGRGTDNFTADPPNATLSILGKNTIRDVVMELRNPRFREGALLYDIKVLQGNSMARGGACSLFIDAYDEPLAPDSYGGAQRRMYRRDDGGSSMYSDYDIDDGSDIVPHDDATQYDDIDDGSDIVPHDDATQYDDIDDGSDIVPHDDATRRDTIDRRIMPHDDATRRDDIDDGSDIVPHQRR